MDLVCCEGRMEDGYEVVVQTLLQVSYVLLKPGLAYALCDFLEAIIGEALLEYVYAKVLLRGEVV